MKKAWLSCLALLVALCLSPVAFSQDDSYGLVFEGPTDFSGAAGSTVSETYTALISHTGPGPGAQGWSVSLFAATDNAVITSINDGTGDQSTEAGRQFSGGFAQTEVTTGEGSTGDCEGKSGAVTAIILSFGLPRVLPPGSTSSIALLGVDLTFGDADSTAVLQFGSGCKGLGQPVVNNVTQAGVSFPPDDGTLEINLRLAQTCCGSTPESVGFNGARVMSDQTDQLMGIGEECLFNEGLITATGPSQTVYAGVSSGDGSGGVQGWSVSVEVFGPLDVTEVTTANTSGALAPDGRQSGGFEQTEMADPANNGGRKGGVSAIILSFGQPIVLAVPGTESILALTVQPTEPPGADETVEGSLGFRDGLRGIGQPVPNVLTVAGNSSPVCNFFDASVAVEFGGEPPANIFLRGDSNNDRKVNIADPVWTINEMFRGGPASPCEAAGDSNDDGAVDLGDAIYTIEYRFLSGPVPPAPFGDTACTADPTEDDLTCEASSCP